MSKVEKLRNNLMPDDGSSPGTLIENCIMKDRNCKFDFMQVNIHDNERLLRSLPNDKPAGTDQVDGKLLRLAAAQVASPICHIFNKCSEYGVCPKAWKGAKIIPVPKDKKINFHWSKLLSNKHTSCLEQLLKLPLAIKRSDVIMYADDTTPYSAASTKHELEIILNRHLERVSDWVKNNELIVNISKTKSMVFGPRHMLFDDPRLHLSLSGIAIKQVKETKLLGVMLDGQLSWSDHIDGIVAKMGRGIAMIRKCSTYLTLSVISQVIQSLVFCHLQYCPVIWSAASKTDI